MPSHNERIVDQFSRQAVPFSTAPGIRDEEALRLLVATSGAGPDDTVLDVACGPGLVVCAFAGVVREATGIDLTPAMIERARVVAAERGLANVRWQVGDVLPLPFADASFSVVVSRFAFHHFPDPGAVLAEMRRVCTPGGRVVVTDVAVSTDPVKAAAFNRMELLRDPSHVRALTLGDLFAAADLPIARTAAYQLRSEMEGLLARSFPAPGDAERARRMIVDSVADDGLGMGSHRRGDEIHLAYPVAIVVGARA
jgi:SAM-dependent methyltransferase